MAKKIQKAASITHRMADGTVLHGNEGLRTYKLDPDKIPPIALHLFREILLGSTAAGRSTKDV